MAKQNIKGKLYINNKRQEIVHSTMQYRAKQFLHLANEKEPIETKQHRTILSLCAFFCTEINVQDEHVHCLAFLRRNERQLINYYRNNLSTVRVTENILKERKKNRLL